MQTRLQTQVQNQNERFRLESHDNNVSFVEGSSRPVVITETSTQSDSALQMIPQTQQQGTIQLQSPMQPSGLIAPHSMMFYIPSARSSSNSTNNSPALSSLGSSSLSSSS